MYIIKGDNFGPYLQNAYGKSVKVPALRGDIHFEKVDIFGAPWTNKFGYPLVDTSFEGKDFSFGDFHCLNPSLVEKGYGTIDSVEKGTIYATSHSGKKQKFHVGACSRIESTYDLPKAGQNFYWRGVPETDGCFKLYSASCF